MTYVKFDVTVIESPQYLKILIIFFFSICGPDSFSNTIRPPSRYEPMLCLSVILFNLFKISIRTSSQICNNDNINRYQPFRKPSNDPKYIDINSNHPPQILKQLPNSISKRLSENSSSKDDLINPKRYTKNQYTINKSGFNENLI